MCKLKEYVKDSKIKKISKDSRYVVFDKNEGLPIFLGKSKGIPDEISVRITYRDGEIIIHKRGE